MKKIYQFLCSMRFGMILLLLIAALCIAATALGMDSIYTSWYFNRLWRRRQFTVKPHFAFLMRQSG